MDRSKENGKNCIIIQILKIKIINQVIFSNSIKSTQKYIVFLLHDKQFGVKKCKSMLISKEVETILHSALSVDKWAVSYIDIPEVGEDQLKETFEGQVQIEQTDQQKYLGFVLSRTGDNMVNINHIRKKSKGIRRRIFNRLNSLTLKHYYFECVLVM